MFTGLVRDLGVIESIEEVNGNRKFSVRGQIDPKDLTMGASVSHSGVCLTVIDADFSGDVPRWVVEAVPETLRLTSLGSKVAGDRVNLEPSLRLGDELGGHLVFGHVDGLGKIQSIVEEGDGYRVTVEAPKALRPLIALKGSVAVDGISLTIAGVTETGFELAIIPHTFEVTSLGAAKAGDAVNLEADMLARYVSRQMEFR
ncbi:riboflavin synthase [Ponticaulis sp.]|uniref:riboflavin synthase n=1 Tax=Ponticaulis sp. TaxID=2020902 RepID=UPI000C592DB4|nr:riboflavin synthase [Ponticaulis sp.]MAF57716.1 riboflavin synthase [Ponticaulis sp.]MBN04851.1 riboflavin synthase [Ponticaulis sp.]|tara:strand:+ start:88 stop:690 length:603 start_codon:yes stop_codon:yes gene_type:complete